MRIVIAAIVMITLDPLVALASQGPGSGLGTADAKTQAFGAILALFPAIYVAVFGMARWLGFIR